MIKIIDFNSNKLITTYDNNFSLSDIEHELQVNGYEWVTMHNIKGEITITVTNK